MNSTLLPNPYEYGERFAYTAQQCQEWCLQQHFMHDYNFLFIFIVSFVFFFAFRVFRMVHSTGRLEMNDEKAEGIANILLDLSYYLFMIGFVWFVWVNRGLVLG